MSSLYPYAFEGRVVVHDVGTYRYTVVFLPDALAAQPPFVDSPRVRVRGEIADVPFAGAWQPVRGRRFLMLSKQTLKAGGIRIGDAVEVRFRLDDPDAVEVPSELEQALAARPALRRRWAALTAGRRRAFAYRVDSAKAPATRARRVVEVLEMVAEDRAPGKPRALSPAAPPSAPRARGSRARRR